MKLFEVLAFDPKRFLYDLQQELIELEPGLEIDVRKATDDDVKRLDLMLNDFFVLSASAADLTYEVALHQDDFKNWVMTPRLSSMAADQPGHPNASKRVAELMLYQLKQDLITACKITVDHPDLTSSRAFQVWLEKQCFDVFKYLFPGANRRLMKGKDSLNVVVINADGNEASEAGLQSLETRYNSTIVATKKLKRGYEEYEAILLAKLE